MHRRERPRATPNQAWSRPTESASPPPDLPVSYAIMMPQTSRSLTSA